MSRPRQDPDRLTIQAVAKRAGVSAMTVSNVINGTGRASEATRQRVGTVIGELGYVPNQAARRLAGSAVARVGLIYPVADSIYIEATLAAVAVVAAETGVQLIMDGIAPDGLADPSNAVRNMVRQGAQALLMIPPCAEIVSEKYGRLGIPAAAIATASALPDITTIRIDNHAATKAITSHLIAHGRRRIGVIAGPQANSDSAARLEGYRDALRAYGLSPDPELHGQGDFTFTGGLAAAEKLLSLYTRPDAIVAANDDMAAAVLWVAHQRGLSVPTDLSVVGFDDTLLATRVWPQLTTVRQPIQEMAEAAMHFLAAAVRQPEHGMSVKDVVLPFKVIERGSS